VTQHLPERIPQNYSALRFVKATLFLVVSHMTD